MEFLSVVLWLLLLSSMFLPMLRQRILQNARLRLLRALEQGRSSRVIALIHRQETMSFLGVPIFRYITIEDSEEVLRAIRMTPDEMPIDLILHTPGGLVLASEQIAFALCRRKGKVTVLVPHYAMSGGSLIALAADEIVMDRHAALGPVDPQLGGYPAASILRVVSQKPVSEVDDRTLILADMAEKAIGQVRALVKQIIADKFPPEGAEEIATLLTDGRFTHDYPIWADMLKALGLPVSTQMPPEVYQLMDLYPQPGQRRPSVEFIPLPYRPEDSPPPMPSRRRS
ncbi:MAG: hypothetical protein HYY20_04125 [Candidatus Tectomicrobia bacterium]|uniref:Serine protease n=1 Tax=Tectimicrobiota bacterium TaxID=2528274 RepID=A0A932CMW9_UNCTE|nr:hypothetical protein [Candidatus Tectomicrobia bacterium]